MNILKNCTGSQKTCDGGMSRQTLTFAIIIQMYFKKIKYYFTFPSTQGCRNYYLIAVNFFSFDINNDNYFYCDKIEATYVCLFPHLIYLVFIVG